MVRTLMALTAVALLAPMAANAQTATTQTTTTYETPEQVQARPPTSSADVTLGAGVSNFALGLAAISKPGAGYAGTVQLAPSRVLGIEVGYLGAVNDVRSNFATDSRLITNQVGADLRLNFVPSGYDLPGNLRPFVFGGAAYQSINPQNFVPGVTNASALAIPVGGGIEAGVGDFIIGARYTWNFLFQANDAFSGRTVNDWLASVNIGAKFGL